MRHYWRAAPGAADELMEFYLRKNYYKTGSLMANSCRAAALLGAPARGARLR